MTRFERSVNKLHKPGEPQKVTKVCDLQHCALCPLQLINHNFSDKMISTNFLCFS